MIHIFYRVSPYLSSNPNPLGNNKELIIKKCLESFLKFSGKQPITFIVDGLPGELLDYISSYGLIRFSKPGNVETFHQQLDEVCKLDNEEKVMLVEDDYLWRPDSIHLIEAALDQLELVSPYDHPGHYTEERFRDTPKLMRLIGDQVWREAPSNTLTFATKAYVIKQNIDLIKSYGIQDHEMFQSLPVKMFVPIPSIASHLVTGLIAPNFNL